MYRYELYGSVDDVPEAFWEMADSGFGSLYRSKPWLRDSQHKLGNRSLYVGVYSDCIPAALFPIVLFSEPCDYPRWDPARILAKAGKTWTAPVAMCASLFGNGRPFRVGVGCAKPAWVDVIQGLVRRLRVEFGCTALLFPRCPANEELFPTSLAICRVESSPMGIVDLAQHGTWENYCASLKRSVRQSFRREERSAQAHGVSVIRAAVGDLDLTWLGQLGANVFQKYGVDFSAERLTMFLAYMAREFPDKTSVIAAVRSGSILSFTLNVVHGNTLYPKMFGRDYMEDKYGTYFLVAYHEPIKLGFEAGLRIIEYGAEAERTKERRGVSMLPLCDYILDLQQV